MTTTAPTTDTEQADNPTPLRDAPLPELRARVGALVDRLPATTCDITWCDADHGDGEWYARPDGTLERDHTTARGPWWAYQTELRHLDGTVRFDPVRLDGEDVSDVTGQAEAQALFTQLQELIAAIGW